MLLSVVKLLYRRNTVLLRLGICDKSRGFRTEPQELLSTSYQLDILEWNPTSRSLGEKDSTKAALRCCPRRCLTRTEAFQVDQSVPMTKVYRQKGELRMSVIALVVRTSRRQIQTKSID